jgi:uncharacterized membrane protein
MHEPREPAASGHAHDRSADPRAELVTLARHETADLKAGLAKLTLDGSPDQLHAAARIRNYFLAGLVIIGPVVITLYITWHFISAVDGWVDPYVPASYLPFPIPGVGLLLAIVGLTLIGALAANLMGRSLISAGELMLGRMPIVRNVHRGLKEIFSSVVTATGPDMTFQRVALVQFPSKGIWSLAFLTGEAANEIKAHASGEDLVSVFIAHGFLPPSGSTCFMPRKDVLPIKLSVADAAKIILSAGMANPET